MRYSKAKLWPKWHGVDQVTLTTTDIQLLLTNLKTKDTDV